MNEWLKANEHLVVFAIFVSDFIGTMFLIFEYFWGRPDIALKHEAKQRRRIKKEQIATEPPKEPLNNDIRPV